MQYEYLYSHSCDADAISINASEALRYMGVIDKSDGNLEVLAAKAINEIRQNISPKGCFTLSTLGCEGDFLSFSDIRVRSVNLKKNLTGCCAVVLFALTLGHDVDRIISKYSSVSPSHSLALSAAASAAIEGYASFFVGEISSMLSKGGFYLRPRFSPGYGDFSIEYQEKITKALDTARRIGLTLTNELMMLPAKSVTAVMGISETDSRCISEGCEVCLRKNCAYRRNTLT